RRHVRAGSAHRISAFTPGAAGPRRRVPAAGNGLLTRPARKSAAVCNARARLYSRAQAPKAEGTDRPRMDIVSAFANTPASASTLAGQMDSAVRRLGVQRFAYLGIRLPRSGSSAPIIITNYP